MSSMIIFLYFVTAVSCGIILGHLLYEGVQLVSDIVEELMVECKNW